MIQNNQSWTQQKKQNWLINLIFGGMCKQSQEAYMAHIIHLEAVIQDLTKSNSSIKMEFDTLKVDYQKLREENFEINIAIVQKENQIEELLENGHTKTVQSQQVEKPKRRVKF